jgi:hypothetical protein
MGFSLQVAIKARLVFLKDKISFIFRFFFLLSFQYYNIWGNSSSGIITQTINKVAVNIPIGGTSAGMAVLGKIVFTAEHDSVESQEALSDPLSR